MPSAPDFLSRAPICFCASVTDSGLRKRPVANFRQSKRKKRRKQVSHSPSVAPRQLPLGGSLCLCVFFSLCHRENKGNFQAQNPKSAHFSSAAAQSVTMCLPPGGRCHAWSVTEGAREIEKRHILLFLHRSLFPQRLPSFQEGSCRRRRLRGVGFWKN